MQRREFITLVGSAAADAPLAASAQQGEPMRRVAVLMLNPEHDPVGQKRLAALQQELEKLGSILGKNLEVDTRWGAFEPEPARVAVAELLALNPDVILANSVTATRAAQKATQTVPIVFNAVSEPVGLGFVSSLSHPGGNITGFAKFGPQHRGQVARVH